MLVGNGIQMAYSVINAFWVGNGLGDNAMAAVTVSFPAFFVLQALAIGLTMAAGILASQAYGAKDWQHFKKVVQNSFFLTGIASIICTLASFFFAKPILTLIDTPPQIMPMATSYLRIFVWHIPFAFLIFLIASLLRAVGDSRTPLYFQGVAVLLATILDPILMFGWLGFPRFGVNGTAIATVIVNVGASTTALFYLYHKRHTVVPDLRSLQLDWATCWLMVKIGLPSSVQQSIVSISILAITRLVNSFGPSGVAAFGAASRIDQFAFLPAMTVGMAVSTLAGQNVGAQKYDRVHEVFKWGIALGGGIALTASLIFITIPDILMKGFTHSPEVIKLGVHYLRIVGSGYFILATLFVSNGVINGAGKTLVTTFFAMISLLIVRIPAATFLSAILKSMDGIWYGMVIGFLVGMLMSVSYYYSGRWKQPLLVSSNNDDVSSMVKQTTASS
jgi:putative MATE family efflux protein